MSTRAGVIPVVLVSLLMATGAPLGCRSDSGAGLAVAVSDAEPSWWVVRPLPTPPPPPLDTAEVALGDEPDPPPAEPGYVVPADVLFDFGSSELRDGALDALRVVVDDLVAAGAVVVRGHTDAVGGAEYNEALALARAQAVAEALVHLGVAADSLIIEGRGLRCPVADNATAEGRARNRRVELFPPSVDPGCDQPDLRPPQDG